MNFQSWELLCVAFLFGCKLQLHIWVNFDIWNYLEHKWFLRLKDSLSLEMRMRTRTTLWSSWSECWMKRARAPSLVDRVDWVTCRRDTTLLSMTGTMPPKWEWEQASGWSDRSTTAHLSINVSSHIFGTIGRIILCSLS